MKMGRCEERGSKEKEKWKEGMMKRRYQGVLSLMSFAETLEQQRENKSPFRSV
jgi:hypothetical protein